MVSVRRLGQNDNKCHGFFVLFLMSLLYYKLARSHLCDCKDTESFSLETLG